MLSSLIRFCAVAAAMAVAGPVWAAPPASCACKFIGEWQFSWGTATVHPDGTATPHCYSGLCVQSQNWTCDGDTYYFSNSGPPGQFSAKLGSGGTRISGPSCPGDRSKQSRTPPVDPRSDSLAEGYMHGARAAEQECSYEGQMRAAGDYTTAADLYDKAGEPKKAASARARARRATCEALEEVRAILASARARARRATARATTCENAQRAARRKAAQCEANNQRWADAKARGDMQEMLRVRLARPKWCSVSYGH